MPTRSKRQSVAHRLNQPNPSSDHDEDDPPLDDLPMPTPNSTRKVKTPRMTQKAQMVQKDARIAELEASLSGVSADLTQLQNDHAKLRLDYQSILHQKQDLHSTNRNLNSLKWKAQTTFDDELGKTNKRIKRLEKQRESQRETHCIALSDLQDALNGKSLQITHLAQDLAAANNHVASQDTTINSLKSDLQKKQSTIITVRNLLSASRKQTERAKASLKENKKAYLDLRTWDPTENGGFHAASRELARNLSYAGCSAGKVEFVVNSCARAFGIKIRRRFMSRRTVGRTIDEGGKYGDIQLAREIMDAPGFVESSDGTNHRGITVESRHITLLVPSYDPDVDDSDKSTWRHQTRFVEVAPALDHTGQRQFEGTVEAANRLADTYNRSPIAARDKRIMDKNDYWRKKLGENKDHAADGKKAFKISAGHKEDIVVRNMGRVAMEDEDIDTSVILLKILEITDEDLQDTGKISESELAALSSEERSKLVEEVLERKIGDEKFGSLPPAEQQNSCTHVFGGYCCHKDLNVVRIGVAQFKSVYTTYNLPPPVLLANKANDAVINLSSTDPTSPALQHAVDSSSSGAIKRLQLIGALLRHKDGERGYQDKCRIFMQERKLELFNLDEPGTFPDVPTLELVFEVIDGKTKSGQPNHVEQNILKGINCSATMAELVALGLYGVSVSWPYMAMVRGTKENPINLLSLTDLHRKLPEFCTYIAENPYILLDPTTPHEQLTIDGRPLLDDLLLPSIQQLRPDLPNMFLIISKMFEGCATGWVHFTPEFHVGGTFDSLTPEQRAILFIPSTNDANEGMLGSYGVHMRYHPNSTAHSFSNQTRCERNNTEAFIKKFCDAAVQKFIMREVRKDGARGVRAKFRRAWAALQQEKAEKALNRRKKTAAKKKLTAFRLATTSLELDISKIETMSSPLLKAQLHVYRDVLKDETLVQMRWKDMSKVAVRRSLVLEARERELARRRGRSGTSPSEITPGIADEMAIDEYGYVADDDAEWEDVTE